MATDHLTDEMTVDEEVPPATSGAPGAPLDSMMVDEAAPGVPDLDETPPPTLLFVDRDERPEWLISSTIEFFQYISYYGPLSKVVDLFFTQEAKLSYPEKASSIPLYTFVRR